jgi:S-adenosylhomocysteine hydrolase
MTIQTAVLIETLSAWGPRCGGARAISFHAGQRGGGSRAAEGHVEQPAACRSSRGRARRSRVLVVHRARDRFRRRQRPDQIVDDGGDVTLLITKGTNSKPGKARAGDDGNEE